MSRARGQLTLVPLTYRNVVAALRLARKSFGPEFPLVVGTYAWHFYRQARLPDPGFMAKRSTASLFAREPTRLVTFVTTVIHGDDICWVDDVQGGWGEELRSFAESWRVCLFRSDRPDPPVEGTVLRGTMPSRDGKSTYLYSLPRQGAEDRKPASRVLQRQRLKTSADFFTLSRAGRTVGITGLTTRSIGRGSRGELGERWRRRSLAAMRVRSDPLNRRTSPKARRRLVLYRDKF